MFQRGERITIVMDEGGGAITTYNNEVIECTDAGLLTIRSSMGQEMVINMHSRDFVRAYRTTTFQTEVTR
jgi:hypothetical protein